MLSTPILLDYQSSTPCSKDVVDAMQPFWTEIFSNPSSKSNLASINASAILEASREKIEQNLLLNNKKVVFTSGATESNNLALLFCTMFRLYRIQRSFFRCQYDNDQFPQNIWSQRNRSSFD